MSLQPSGRSGGLIVKHPVPSPKRRAVRKAHAPLSCSFCAKPQAKVRRLIAGPDAYICNECVDTSSQVLRSADIPTFMATSAAIQLAQALIASAKSNLSTARSLHTSGDGLGAVAMARSAAAEALRALSLLAGERRATRSRRGHPGGSLRARRLSHRNSRNRLPTPPQSDRPRRRVHWCASHRVGPSGCRPIDGSLSLTRCPDVRSVQVRHNPSLQRTRYARR